jgi:hypothetical protein
MTEPLSSAADRFICDIVDLAAKGVRGCYIPTHISWKPP